MHIIILHYGILKILPLHHQIALQPNAGSIRNEIRPSGPRLGTALELNLLKIKLFSHTGETWKDTIHKITAASIKFELLSMVAHQQAKLDFEASETAVQGNKGGVFVLYNCARLSTLFFNYEKAVSQGIHY